MTLELGVGQGPLVGNDGESTGPLEGLLTKDLVDRSIGFVLAAGRRTEGKGCPDRRVVTGGSLCSRLPTDPGQRQGLAPAGLDRSDGCLRTITIS